MINKLSEKLTTKMIRDGSIGEEDRELYVYGFFVLLSQIIYFAIVCFLGLLFGCLLQSVIFFVAFQFIRKYAGGYHASTETRCDILSTLSLSICIVLIKLSTVFDIRLVLTIVALISAVCIFCLCPLDTAEKPLSEKEFKYFRKISVIILTVIVTAVAVSYFAGFDLILVPCCLSLALEGILILAGKMKKLHRPAEA